MEQLKANEADKTNVKLKSTMTLRQNFVGTPSCSFPCCRALQRICLYAHGGTQSDTRIGSDAMLAPNETFRGELMMRLRLARDVLVRSNWCEGMAA